MWMSEYDFVYTECLETLSEDRDGWCRCGVRWWSDTRTWKCRRSVRDTSALVPKCPKDTSAPIQKIRHFGTKRRFSRTAKLSQVQSVLGPKCPYTPRTHWHQYWNVGTVPHWCRNAHDTWHWWWIDHCSALVSRCRNSPYPRGPYQ